MSSAARRGVAVCQRLEHNRTPLIDRNHGHLEHLIAATTVPRLCNPVDPHGVLKRMIALSVVHIDCPPRGQDEDPRKVLVLREPDTELALAQRCNAIDPAEGIEHASLKEDVALTCRVTSEVLDVHPQRFL